MFRFSLKTEHSGLLKNVWLNFLKEVNTINYHLKEIFKSGELQADSTIRKIRIVQ